MESLWWPFQQREKEPEIPEPVRGPCVFHTQVTEFTVFSRKPSKRCDGYTVFTEVQKGGVPYPKSPGE